MKVELEVPDNLSKEEAQKAIDKVSSVKHAVSGFKEDTKQAYKNTADYLTSVKNAVIGKH